MADNINLYYFISTRFSGGLNPLLRHKGVHIILGGFFTKGSLKYFIRHRFA